MEIPSVLVLGISSEDRHTHHVAPGAMQSIFWERGKGQFNRWKPFIQERQSKMYPVVRLERAVYPGLPKAMAETKGDNVSEAVYLKTR